MKIIINTEEEEKEEEKGEQQKRQKEEHRRGKPTTARVLEGEGRKREILLSYASQKRVVLKVQTPRQKREKSRPPLRRRRIK